MDDDLHRSVAARLRERGQRYTRSRRVVVAALDASRGPLTLPEILEAGPDLAQSSTYRNLSELIELGVVERVVTSDEHSRYELTEAVTGHHHHHLVCSTCGAVTDVAVPDDVERSLDTSVRVLAAEHGFDLDHHRLDLVGTCGGCR